MADEEVVEYAKTGNKQGLEHLMRAYKGLIESRAKRRFIVGAEPEDLLQEAWMGFFKAVRDFHHKICPKTGKPYSFLDFVRLCVDRQVLQAVQKATRQKQGPLNLRVSPSRDDTASWEDFLGDSRLADPLDLMINAEERSIFDEVKKDLSDLETRVLNCYLKDMSYQEMAEEIGCKTKSIDNALRRIKRKIEERMGDI